MSDKIAALEAELALARAEVEFVAKKEAGEVSDEDRQALRALRQEYRESVRPGLTALLGANVVAPAAIGAKGKVE